MSFLSLSLGFIPGEGDQGGCIAVTARTWAQHLLGSCRHSTQALPMLHCVVLS